MDVERTQVEVLAGFATSTKRTNDKQLANLAEENFGETDENRSEMILQFRDKLKSTHPELLEDMPGTADDFLLKFLRAGAFDVEKSVHVMKNYIDMITSGPKYFAPAFDKDPDAVAARFQSRNFIILPSRDKFRRRVYIWRPGMWDPDKISLGEYYSCGYLLFEMISVEEESQIAGLTIVCDATNFGLKQLRNISISDLKFFAMFVQVS